MLLWKYRIIIYIGIILFIVEVGLKYRAYKRGWETLLFGFNKPEVLESSDKTNSKMSTYGPSEGFPFRSAIVEEKKPKKAVRIWMSSSSYGEDIYVSPDKIFPNLIKNQLELSVEMEVQTLNASRAGTTIGSNTQEIRELSAKWQPDIVVLYQMSNDLNSILASGLMQNQQQGEPKTPSSIYTFFQPIAPINAREFFEKTTLYANSKSLLTPSINYSRILQDHVDTRVIKVFTDSLEDYIKTAKSLEIEVMLCTFALSHGPDRNDDPPKDVMYPILRYNRYLSFKGWQNYVSEMNEVIRQKAMQNNIILIDVADQMTGKTSLFRDFFHFTKEGHKEVARIIGHDSDVIRLVNSNEF